MKSQCQIDPSMEKTTTRADTFQHWNPEIEVFDGQQQQLTSIRDDNWKKYCKKQTNPKWLEKPHRPESLSVLFEQQQLVGVVDYGVKQLMQQLGWRARQSWTPEVWQQQLVPILPLTLPWPPLQSYGSQKQNTHNENQCYYYYFLFQICDVGGLAIIHNIV